MFDIREVSLDSVYELFFCYHAYGGTSATATYVFGVFEDDVLVAAYTWQPPPPGAAKNICPEEPGGVLALSRMVAVPKNQRRLKHISKPLMVQMKKLIDRGRWPVLVTYSDEGLNHNGYVYQCSGWTPTSRNLAKQYVDKRGTRTSPYSRGKTSTKGLTFIGEAWLQRWEHWACPKGEVAEHMKKHGWVRRALPGKTWRSGRQAHRWFKD